MSEPSFTEHETLDAYLRTLRRELAPLPAGDRDEIVAEFESHVSEKLDPRDPSARLESVITRFGPPEAYARRFLDNYGIASALEAGTTLAMIRQAARLTSRGTAGFLGGFGLLSLYLVGIALLVVGLVKPVFPDHVGLWTSHDGWFTMGLVRDARGLSEEVLGYWIMPISIVGSILLLALSKVLTRRFLRAFRDETVGPAGPDRP